MSGEIDFFDLKENESQSLTGSGSPIQQVQGTGSAHDLNEAEQTATSKNKVINKKITYLSIISFTLSGFLIFGYGLFLSLFRDYIVIFTESNSIIAFVEILTIGVCIIFWVKKGYDELSSNRNSIKYAGGEK